MAAMVKTHKPRTLRALSVDAILAHVARFDVRESSRAKADAALMDDSGDGALHRVTMLKALGRVELARLGYTVVGTPVHGYCYFGSGQKNYDIAFMLP